MTALLIGVLLLAGNAFFVGAEFAIMSARRSQIEPRAAAGSAAARTTLHAMEHVSLMLATCQLGITVCSLGLGAVAEPALAHLLEVPFAAIGVPSGLVHPIAFALALSLVVYLHVVAGEMVPKNIAIASPERAALLLAPPLVWVTRVVRPLVWALNTSTNLLLRLFGVEPRDEVASTYTVEQVTSIVQESHREGLIADGRLMTEALEFSDHTAGDVMIPLDEVVSLPADATPADAERLLRRHGFSRYLVWLDEDRLGYVHVKDLLELPDDAYDQPIPEWVIRRTRTVAFGAEVEEALAAMQRSGGHLAPVVDRRMAVVGVVFLEDVLEELVGEILDEPFDTKGRRRR